MVSAVRRPLVLGIDAGGTMTDTFIVDEEGNFEVGKAPTTPQDESVGFLESTQDAISYWEGMKLCTLERLCLIPCSHGEVRE